MQIIHTILSHATIKQKGLKFSFAAYVNIISIDKKSVLQFSAFCWQHFSFNFGFLLSFFPSINYKVSSRYQSITLKTFQFAQKK